jgi:hypothetical protein
MDCSTEVAEDDVEDKQIVIQNPPLLPIFFSFPSSRLGRRLYQKLMLRFFGRFIFPNKHCYDTTFLFTGM